MFTDIISLDMANVVPTISGPKRPQDKVLLNEAPNSFKKVMQEATGKKEKSVLGPNLELLRLFRAQT